MRPSHTPSKGTSKNIQLEAKEDKQQKPADCCAQRGKPEGRVLGQGCLDSGCQASGLVVAHATSGQVLKEISEKVARHGHTHNRH